MITQFLALIYVMMTRPLYGIFWCRPLGISLDFSRTLQIGSLDLCNISQARYIQSFFRYFGRKHQDVPLVHICSHTKRGLNYKLIPKVPSFVPTKVLSNKMIHSQSSCVKFSNQLTLCSLSHHQLISQPSLAKSSS